VTMPSPNDFYSKSRYNQHMNTKTDLENSLKDAMRAKDELRKRTIRMALSAIRLTEIDRGSPLDESAVLATIQKEIKSRQESIADAQQAHRPDLIDTSLDEIAVLESFLPPALSEAELSEMVQQAIAEVGATSQREMGKVMKVLLPRLQGRATGDQASQIVRKLLS
jgi:uncharacterized protein